MATGIIVRDQMTPFLKELKQNCTANLEPVLRQIGLKMQERFAQQFDAEGTPQWQELAERTRKERKRKGFGQAHPILNRTGALRRSYTKRGTRGSIFKVEKNRVTVGSSIPYAADNQNGAHIPPKRETALMGPAKKGKGLRFVSPTQYLSLTSPMTRSGKMRPAREVSFMTKGHTIPSRPLVLTGADLNLFARVIDMHVKGGLRKTVFSQNTRFSGGNYHW